MKSGMRLCRVQRTNSSKWVFVGVLAVFLLSSGLVWASSAGHESAVRGWEPTDTYRVMNFVVLAAALFFVLRKPVAQALQGRISGIKEQLADLESRKLEAEKTLAQYNERLTLLDKEKQKIIESYIAQGKEARTRILQEAKSSAEKLEAQARRQIENAFDRARAELQGAILEKAIEKAESAIRENISAEDQVRLVNDYLEKVVA